ncbi:MAG: DUF1249 domain-containing protein [Candidatus Dependentiae bacterium]|nr:DUF1249 domain-containing protein [Candidatus Dependentiae bacterium]
MLKKIILPIVLLIVGAYSNASEHYSYISSSPKTESRVYKDARMAEVMELERISNTHRNAIIAVQGEEGISFFEKTPEKPTKTQSRTNSSSRVNAVARKLSF